MYIDTQTHTHTTPTTHTCIHTHTSVHTCTHNSCTRSHPYILVQHIQQSDAHALRTHTHNGTQALTLIHPHTHTHHKHNTIAHTQHRSIVLVDVEGKCSRCLTVKQTRMYSLPKEQRNGALVVCTQTRTHTSGRERKNTERERERTSARACMCVCVRVLHAYRGTNMCGCAHV